MRHADGHMAGSDLPKERCPKGAAHEKARLTAAAQALHSWQSDIPWDHLTKAAQDARRRHALWVLLAADAADARGGVVRLREHQR